VQSLYTSAKENEKDTWWTAQILCHQIGDDPVHFAFFSGWFCNCRARLGLAIHRAVGL
jgi:hypothetical protein